MAYKIINKTQLDYDLKRVADAIRTTGRLSPTARLTFPEGMAEVIRGWSINNSMYDGNYYPSICPDAAKYVLVDGADLDAKIKTVCDAFRAIYFSSDNIQFPDELIRRIECLDVGGGGDQPTTYITFYYQSSQYTVASGTTWGQLADSGVISGLSVRYVGNDAYIFDYNYDSYVGTYENNSAVKASDIIVDYQSYYYGFEPGGSSSITFYMDSTSYTVASGTTIKQWLNSGNAPSYYADSNGYLYNMSAGYYVAEDDDLSNGTYYAASVDKVIYDSDNYISWSDVHPPVSTSSFYINGYDYEFYEGDTWGDTLSKFGEYDNILGHMGAYYGDGILWDEAKENILLSSDNMSNHTFMPVRSTDIIQSGENYIWEPANYISGSFAFSNMSTLPTSNEEWYMFNQPVEMQIYEPDIYGTTWTSEHNYYLNLSTSSTNRNVLESYYGGPVQLPDHGVVLSSSNSSNYRYIFYQNAQYNYTVDNMSSDLIYPVGKIKLSPGAYPSTFVTWLLANTRAD